MGGIGIFASYSLDETDLDVIQICGRFPKYPYFNTIVFEYFDQWIRLVLQTAEYTHCICNGVLPYNS